MAALYLGLDSSTQGLKAEIIDPASGSGVGCWAVNFGRDLPQYRSPNGYLEHADPAIRHADPALWLAALDLLFDRMNREGAPLSQIAGISGSGQQHGSVCCGAGFAAALAALTPERTLAEQLVPTLTRATAPIWMDSSTGKECDELTARFGRRLQEDTGSFAAARFTGPQIRKFAKDAPDAYRATATIHLVSSFLCSVLIGRQSPIDFGDGAGMNLLNLHTMSWDAEIAEFTAPGLLDKLPPCVPSDTVAGTLSGYFTRYGLKPGVPVAVWSGDNPCSLIGAGGGAPGTAVISLGTSDTFFGAMRNFSAPSEFGHVFGNPAGGVMTLLCFTNGSLARETVKAECNVSWQEFDGVNSAAPGRKLMLPYFAAESTPPHAPGVRYNFSPSAATSAEKIRALLESQALTMRLHGENSDPVREIRLTGGASASVLMRQIIANVFQAPVKVGDNANSASLGAAMRAANAVGRIPFTELTATFCRASLEVQPDPKLADIYRQALDDYRKLEQQYR